ncbi:Late transcription factor VLTF-4 (1), partial [Monkeypox virus]
KDL